MTGAKQKSLYLLFAAAVITLLVAMILPKLELFPGLPITLDGLMTAMPGGPGGAGDGSFVLLIIIQGMVALGVLLLPVYIVLSMMTREGRRRLLAQGIAMAILLLIVDYLQKLPRTEPEPEAEEITSDPREMLQGAGSTPAGLLPDTPPPELVLLIALAMAGAVSAGGFWWYLQRQPPPESPFQKLADEARQAMVALDAGDEFESTIIRCYHQMSQVLRDELGIMRETFMTPREFEAQLVKKGLPAQSLGTLTSLFEQARYSVLPAGDREQALAMTCLTDIIDACTARDGGIDTL